MSPGRDKDGYLLVSLRKDGKTHMRKVHRLVAEAYIPNPEGKPTVNHKDEVKDHNWVGNLEWMTMKENNNYGTRTQKTSKPVLCVETGVTYDSISKAAAAVDRTTAAVCRALRGRSKTCANYHWEYA